MPITAPEGYLDISNATLRGSEIITTSNVGVMNANPTMAFSVGSNLHVNVHSSNVLQVSGNIVAEGIKIGFIEIVPSYDFGAVSNVGNTTTSTIQFANATTAFVTTSNAGIGMNTPAHTLDVAGDINLTSNIVMSSEVFIKAHDATKNYVAIGRDAGQTSQGTNAVAVGYRAGQTSQSNSAVAVGVQAGETSQGDSAVAVGVYAGQTSQGGNAVAVGLNAGRYNQDTSAVAVGVYAGQTSQRLNATAVGVYAGQTSQGTSAVAIGNEAGRHNQGGNAVAVGRLAGETSQGSNAIAVGDDAGLTNQGSNSVAVGNSAGATSQGAFSVAAGYLAGVTDQGGSAVAIGREAGRTSQGTSAVAVGQNAGLTSQGTQAVAVGLSAGQTSQGVYSVAVGVAAGQDYQGSYTVAVGNSAGQTNQGQNATAVGRLAGYNNQGNYATAVGRVAGYFNQGSYATALGVDAGYNAQGSFSVAVGYAAGNQSQGANAVAVGDRAGQTSQSASAIAVGPTAAQSYQGSYAVAVGVSAGRFNQGIQAIAIGNVAGETSQDDFATAVGTNAGQTAQGYIATAVGHTAGRYNQGDNATAVGYAAGQTSQGGNAVAVGYQAGYTVQGQYTVAVGRTAGATSQGTFAVAVGINTGYLKQGSSATAMGMNAGNTSQGVQAVAVGNSAGYTAQGYNATAVGHSTGYNNQGDRATAIGVSSGYSNQGSYSTALGANAGTYNQPSESLYCAYVRDANGSEYLHYNNNTGEISRGNAYSSDDRIKYNEKIITGAIKSLFKLRPEEYDKKPSLKPSHTGQYWRRESGLIAQEIYYSAPEFRHIVQVPQTAGDVENYTPPPSDDPNQDPDYSVWGEDSPSVDYKQFVPYLIKAVQEIVTELPRSKTTVSNTWGQNIVGLVVSANANAHKTNTTPLVALSNVYADKAWYGVVSTQKTDTNDYDTLVDTKGDTQIWVTDVGGSLESGDLVTTSNVAPGYAQKQDSGALMNYTVAKVTQDCDFTEPTQRAIKVPKQELSNVTYYLRITEQDINLDAYEKLYETQRKIKTTPVYVKEVGEEEGGEEQFFHGEIRVSEEKYKTLPEDERSKKYIVELETDKYDELSDEEKATYTLGTRERWFVVTTTKSKNPIPEHTEEVVVEELVDVLDDNGQIVWEETGETEPVYTLVDHGTYKAALVSAKLV